MGYCKNCKFSFGFDCAHKDNIKGAVDLKWYDNKPVKIFKRKPEDINENNDCIWYKKR